VTLPRRRLSHHLALRILTALRISASAFLKNESDDSAMAGRVKL